MGKLKSYTEMRRNNWAVLFGYTVMDAVLVLCYLVEVIKKSRTIGYFAVFCLLALVPLIIVHLIYRKDPESQMIKRIITGGFGLFYYFVTPAEASSIKRMASLRTLHPSRALSATVKDIWVGAPFLRVTKP